MFFYTTIAFLLLCFIQDVKYRGIFWIVFPLLLASCVLLRWETLMWKDLIFNFLFLTATMLGLTFYLSIKLKKRILITNGHFSLGDILFLIAIIPLFSLDEYILFFTAGTIFTLLIHILINQVKKQQTIPYAGYMSIATILVLVFQGSIRNNFAQSWM